MPGNSPNPPSLASCWPLLAHQLGLSVVALFIFSHVECVMKNYASRSFCLLWFGRKEEDKGASFLQNWSFVQVDLHCRKCKACKTLAPNLWFIYLFGTMNNEYSQYIGRGKSVCTFSRYFGRDLDIELIFACIWSPFFFSTCCIDRRCFIKPGNLGTAKLHPCLLPVRHSLIFFFKPPPTL